MKIFLISDTHFGIKNSSQKWLNVMTEWWEKHLIPTLKNEMEDGDLLLHLGDLFDIRTHTNELIRSTVVDLINNTLTKIPKNSHFYILAGNHDVYFKNSNKISSLDPLDSIHSRLHIVKEPLEVTLKDDQILLQPWENDMDKLGENLQKSKADWVFMHADIQGLRYNKDLSSLDRGLKLETLSRFKGVFSGHIHWANSNGNVHYVGTPYQLDRGERGNEKSIQCLKLDTGEIIKYINNISPKYVYVDYEDVQNSNLKSKDYIDIKLKPEQAEGLREFLKDNNLENFNLKFEEPTIQEFEKDQKIDFSNSLLEQLLESTKEEPYNLFLEELIKEYESN